MNLEIFLKSEKNETSTDKYQLIDDYNLILYIDPTETLEKTYQEEKVYELVRNAFRSKGYFYDSKDLEKFQIKNAQTIKICSNENNIENTIKFLKNNPSLKSQEPILVVTPNDYDKLDLFLKEDFSTFLKIKIQNQIITYQEFIKMIQLINTIFEKVIELSPLEQLLYLYDEIKRNISEKDQLDNLNSQNITNDLEKEKNNIIKSTVIFDFVVKKLGMNSAIDILKQNNSKKQYYRNFVYVNDEKYNVNSILYFDFYAKSKEEKEDSTYQNYRYFARTKAFFKIIDKDNLISTLTPFFDKNNNPEQAINELNNIQDLKASKLIYSIANYYSLFGMKADYICQLMENNCLKNFIDGKEKCLFYYQDLEPYLEREITIEDLAKCLIFVRQNQQKENSDSYQLNQQILTDTLINTYIEEYSDQQQLYDKALELANYNDFQNKKNYNKKRKIKRRITTGKN